MCKWLRDYTKEYLVGMAARNASQETISGYSKDLEMVS